MTPVDALMEAGATAPSIAETLSSAIACEVRLLNDLVGVMRKQRASVVLDDLQGVDDSVFATHRILVTLGEARRKRQSAAWLIGGNAVLDLHELDELLRGQMTDNLRCARQELVEVAGVLAREVELNREVLRKARAAAGD